MDFERGLAERIATGAQSKLVDLSRDVPLIEGGCDSHAHGADPHIWTSPKALKYMAENAFERIAILYPDSMSYRINFVLMCEEFKLLDKMVSEKLESSTARSFLIFHPGLTYYAKDYALRQIAIEHEGKEPSARHLSTIIDEARGEGITKVLYQKEYPKSSVEVVAKELGAEVVEIDILSPEVSANIMNITNIIASE
jgi:zinc transport system substrate-binding protein